MKRSMHWSCTSLMIMILFSHCQGHRLSSGSVAGAKVFERDNRGNFLYNVADEGAVLGLGKRSNYHDDEVTFPKRKNFLEDTGTMMSLGKRNSNMNYHKTGILRGLRKKSLLSHRKDIDTTEPSDKLSREEGHYQYVQYVPVQTDLIMGLQLPNYPDRTRESNNWSDYLE